MTRDRAVAPAAAPAAADDAPRKLHVAGRLGLLVRQFALATRVATWPVGHQALWAAVVAVVVATRPAAAHRFPAVRDVVVQVERCEVVLLVGYRPGSGEATDAILGRAGGAPRGKAVAALRDALASYAMAPLAVSIDGVGLVPTAVEAKLGVEPGGARPMVVLLVTYAAPQRGTLAVTTRDPRSTRVSWHDEASGRVAIPTAPAQGKWFTGVASFLLDLAEPWGAASCATPRPTR